MNKFLTPDEIIDKHVFNVKIYTHVRAHDPEFIADFERFAVGMSGDNPAIWWTVMKEKIMKGTVYVFENKDDFLRFQKMNSSFINKINFIL